MLEEKINHREGQTLRLIHGDCIEQMQKLPPESIGSVITDPPYG